MCSRIEPGFFVLHLTSLWCCVSFTLNLRQCSLNRFHSVLRVSHLTGIEGIVKYKCRICHNCDHLCAIGMNEGRRGRNFREVSLRPRYLEDIFGRGFSLSSKPRQRGRSLRSHPRRGRTHGVRGVRQLDAGARLGHRSTGHA